MPKKKSVKKYPTIYVGYSEEKTTEIEKDSEGSEYFEEYVDWDLVGCFANKNNPVQYKTTIGVNFDYSVGDEVYVVYVKYTTYETFGVTHGAADVISVCKTKKEADKLKASLDEIRRFVDKQYGIMIYESSSCSFHGCYIEKCIVQ